MSPRLLTAMRSKTAQARNDPNSSKPPASPFARRCASAQIFMATSMGWRSQPLLKSRIDALCMELSGLVANQPDLIAGRSSQSQSQGSQQQGGSGPAGPVSLFVPPTGGGSGNWWPED